MRKRASRAPPPAASQSTVLLFGPRRERADVAPATFALDAAGKPPTATALLRFVLRYVRALRSEHVRYGQVLEDLGADQEHGCCALGQQETRLRAALGRAAGLAQLLNH